MAAEVSAVERYLDSIHAPWWPVRRYISWQRTGMMSRWAARAAALDKGVGGEAMLCCAKRCTTLCLACTCHVLSSSLQYQCLK